jgi:hypothetical protein
MHRRTVLLLSICLCVARLSVHAQGFKLFDRQVQIHGFASQGFVYTNDNNWLTMNTSSGSAAMTDMGLNVSMPVTDKLRIGAQVYDRNLGHLGQWHPSLDWAYAQYKFKPWLGIRGGKVKTVLGLYNDTQDLDFLHAFALLPQSVYPIDTRDATLAHTGVDIFGDVPLRQEFGTFSYTAYVGHRQDDLRGGYAYLFQNRSGRLSNYSGLQFGGDLRWATPLKGLLLGISRLSEDVNGQATIAMAGGFVFPIQMTSRSQYTNQYYGRYSWSKLTLDAEYRRYWSETEINQGLFRVQTDVRGWYVAGSYQVTKRVQFGSYYSRYWMNFPLAFPGVPAGTSHVSDKVVSARFHLNRFMNFKLEGHFMDGYGLSDEYPNGFYTSDNPQGLKPNTNALVLKTSLNF